MKKENKKFFAPSFFNKIVNFCLLAWGLGIISHTCVAADFFVLCPPDPPVARHDEIYDKFLSGKLIYRPDPSSDEGKVELRIADLEDPMNGTFDLSCCGDTENYLSISTGYRKGKKPENADKVEIWFTPRFLIERELDNTARHFGPIMNSWKPEKALVGLFWTWGGLEDSWSYDYLISRSMDEISNDNLHRHWLRSRALWDRHRDYTRQTVTFIHLFGKLAAVEVALQNFTLVLDSPVMACSWKDRLALSEIVPHPVPPLIGVGAPVSTEDHTPAPSIRDIASPTSRAITFEDSSGSIASFSGSSLFSALFKNSSSLFTTLFSSSSSASTTPPGLSAPSEPLSVPLVDKGYEAIYERFLKGALIYKPDPSSDEGKIELRVADLKDPLNGTFDLSCCGDTEKYLSISTGYRKGKKPENADKVEIWLTPRFLIERELDNMAAHFEPIMKSWESEKAPVGLFWTWGGWDDLLKYDYLTSQSMDAIGNGNLYQKWRCNNICTAGGWLHSAFYCSVYPARVDPITPAVFTFCL